MYLKVVFFTFSEYSEQAWSKFKTCIFKGSKDRLLKPPKEFEKQLIHDIQNHYGSNTEIVADNIVFCRVEKCQASNIDDVCKYLIKSKEELKVGQPGFPTQVVVIGDQQTYSLAKTLLKKYPNEFDWVILYPGDWHMLKLAAETIRDMIWDGGLQFLAKNCKFTKEVHQWKDIHNLLTSLHECLARKLVIAYQEADNPNQSFDEFCESLKSESNPNEKSRFWSQTFEYLNAYNFFLCILP